MNNAWTELVRSLVVLQARGGMKSGDCFRAFDKVPTVRSKQNEMTNLLRVTTEFMPVWEPLPFVLGLM